MKKDKHQNNIKSIGGKRMLKIKDNVNLKELEKYGFKKEENYYFLDFLYDEGRIECSYISISAITRLIYFIDVDWERHSNLAIDLIYDLIQAGLVEKE